MSVLGPHAGRELHWEKTSKLYGEFEPRAGEAVLGTLMFARAKTPDAPSAVLTLGAAVWHLTSRTEPGGPAILDVTSVAGEAIAHFESTMTKGKGFPRHIVLTVEDGEIARKAVRAKGGTWTFVDGATYHWRKPTKGSKDMSLQDEAKAEVFGVHRAGIFQGFSDRVMVQSAAAADPHLDLLVGASYFVFFAVNGRND